MFNFLKRTVKTKKTSDDKKDDSSSQDKATISRTLSDNIEYIKKAYTVPVNYDLVIRDFTIFSEYPAFIAFFDGLIDRDLVTDSLLKQLMTPFYDDNFNIPVEELIYNRLLPQVQVKKIYNYHDVILGINVGECALFIKDLNLAFVCDVKKWEHRNVDISTSESSIRGPQEGFIEILKTNTSLVRKIIRNENLIIENMSIGTTYKTDCCILYMKNIANQNIINEVKKKLNNITVDYVAGTGDLEQIIEDKHYFLFPQMMSTERPDRVAGFILEGRIAIIVNGNPYALILPITILDTFYSNDDDILRVPFKIFLKIVRICSIIMTLFVPSIFIAAVSYHHDIIPTNLLLAMSAVKEKVPFPFFVELIFMELLFEIVQESRLRIPSQLGSVIGLVGSLILGQSAVAANIISPITIIVASMSIISSLAIPNYYMSYGFRLLRLLIMLGALLYGILGLSLVLYAFLLYTFSLKPLNTPLVPPIYTNKNDNIIKRLLGVPIYRLPLKPYYLNEKKNQKY